MQSNKPPPKANLADLSEHLLLTWGECGLWAVSQTGLGAALAAGEAGKVRLCLAAFGLKY